MSAITARRSIVLGLVAFVAALLWLLRAVGLFPPYIDDLIVRSTPLLLVIFGLMLLLRGRVPLGEIVAVLVSLGLVGGVGYTAFSLRQQQVLDDNTLTAEQVLDDEIILLR
ncbi:MAG: hypothetical protein AAF125_04310, partial [Chloroflexota bacterium]